MLKGGRIKRSHSRCKNTLKGLSGDSHGTLHTRNFSRAHTRGMCVPPCSEKYFYATGLLLTLPLRLIRGTSPLWGPPPCLWDQARPLLTRQGLSWQREKLKHGEHNRTHLFPSGEPSLQKGARNKHQAWASSPSTAGRPLHTQLPRAAAKVWSGPGRCGQGPAGSLTLAPCLVRSPWEAAKGGRRQRGDHSPLRPVVSPSGRRPLRRQEPSGHRGTRP